MNLQRPADRGDPLLHVVLFGLSAFVLGLSSVLEIRSDERVVLPVARIPIPGVCTYKQLFGADCPGCGLTRCFISLAHGQMVRAWRFNPAGVYLFGMVVVQIPYRALQLWRLQRGRPEIRLGRVTVFAMGVLVIALLVQWIVRATAALA
jgi:hypothetical protein